MILADLPEGGPWPGRANSSSLATPARLPGRGYERRTNGPGWRVPGRPPSVWALWGRVSRHAAGRFGEFLAVAGVAAYRPSEGPGRPDFEHAAGAFVPVVRVLYGLAFPTGSAAVIRFEAKGGARTSSPSP